jgi:enoyl-CoA hydratase/carnithine racemase
MYETITLEKKEGIAYITFNRPDKLNAINIQLKKEFVHALDDCEQDDDIRVAILSGAGRSFSSGHDMTEKGTIEDSRFHLQAAERLLSFEKPIIAAVKGYALGDGLQQALLCDIIIATEDSVMGFIGPRVGAICWGAVWCLQESIGWKHASELLLTCRKISGKEAFAMGLASHVTTTDKLMPKAVELAQEIKISAPLAVKHTKKLLQRGLWNQETRDTVWRALCICHDSEDLIEAMLAFKEKREPVFRGR